MGGVCHMWVGFVTCGALSYVGGICQIWGAGFVISGWGLSNVGGFVKYGRGLSNMGGICHPLGFVIFLAGFVKYGRDLSRDLSHKVVKNPKKCPYLTNPVTNPITFLCPWISFTGPTELKSSSPF